MRSRLLAASLSALLLPSVTSVCIASPQPTTEEFQKLLTSQGLVLDKTRAAECLHVEVFDEKTNRVTFTDNKGERRQLRFSPDTPQGRRHIYLARTYEYICEVSLESIIFKKATVGKFAHGGDLTVLLVTP